MKDIFLNEDDLIDELENKFQNNIKEGNLDDIFEVKIDYENNDLFNTLTEDTNLNISIPNDEKEENTNKITTSNKVKRGRPKGSLKKVSREKIVDKKITISLSLEEKEALEKKAALEDRSVSSFIRVKLKELGVFK